MKYNKLEIVVTELGDFIMAFTERITTQNAETGNAMGLVRWCWRKHLGTIVKEAGD